MVIERIKEEQLLKRIAPLTADFRVTLKSLKGIVSEPDVAEGGGIELKEYLDAGFPIYAARDQETYCGYMVCRIEEPCVWMESIYVLPQYRKQGVASLLFARAEELAYEYGGETVYNYVHPNNDGMIAFLRSKGYSVLNLLEIRKPYSEEKPTRKIIVDGKEFDY